MAPAVSLEYVWEPQQHVLWGQPTVLVLFCHLTSRTPTASVSPW